MNGKDILVLPDPKGIRYESRARAKTPFAAILVNGIRFYFHLG
jgi:hypothetical protein